MRRAKVTPGSASHTFWGAGGRQKRFGELAFIVPTFLTCKKTPEGAGTHTGHTSAHADTRITQTNLTTIHTHRQSTHPHDHHDHATAETAKRETAADSTAARTAAGPEPTAPHGRLRRGRPQRTRPCLHPLPERLPAPAHTGGEPPRGDTLRETVGNTRDTRVRRTHGSHGQTSQAPLTANPTHNRATSPEPRPNLRACGAHRKYSYR